MDFGIFAPQAKKISWTKFMDFCHGEIENSWTDSLNPIAICKMMTHTLTNMCERSEQENLSDFE